jgi:hypothetical protein
VSWCSAECDIPADEQHRARSPSIFRFARPGRRVEPLGLHVGLPRRPSCEDSRRPFLFRTVVGVGWGMTVVGPRLGTLVGTLRTTHCVPTPYARHQLYGRHSPLCILRPAEAVSCDGTGATVARSSGRVRSARIGHAYSSSRKCPLLENEQFPLRDSNVKPHQPA